jgi:replicative DNA helicase
METEIPTQQGRDQERAVLAAVLRKPAVYPNIREILKPVNFGWKAYGEVFQAFENIHAAGMSIDALTVGDELERMGKLDIFTNTRAADGIDPGFTGRAALSKLREAGEPNNAITYAENVLDYSAKWQQFQLFQKGAYWASNGRRSADIANDVSREMETIRTSSGKAASHTQTLKEAIKDAYQETDRASRGEIQFIQTGWTDLDKILSGFSEPDLIIIAGRPGSGKTALLASLIKNIYDRQAEKRIVIFTLEMSNKQIAKRLIAMESGVPFDRQKSGKLLDHEWPIYIHTIEVLGDKKNIFLNDLPAISPNRMKQVIRKIGDVDLVIVDYLQLQSADEKTENRTLEVGSVSRSLKQLAKEMKVPVIAAAAMSRAIESRADGEPQLSDLGESGAIERDSDIVMFIYRDKDPQQQNISHLKIAKHRNGPVGTIDLLYRSSLTRFDNATKNTQNLNEERDVYGQ